MTNGSIGSVSGRKRDDLRTEVREIFWIRRLELAGRTDLVGRVTGHDLINRRRVIEQSIRRVAHRTNHRELVVHLREFRQNFGEIDARNFCGNRFECAANVIGHVLFWVPQIKMARATLEINHHDILGRAPTGTAGCGSLRAERLELQERPERETQNAGASNAQEVAPRHFHSRITKIATRSTSNSNHKTFLVIEQKSGAVDQRPGQVLHYRQSFIFALFDALFRILAQLHQDRIEMNRFFGFF